MNYKEEFLNKILVLDTETTSKDYNDASILESGFVIRENNDWTIFQELHKPENVDIPAQVEALCYITNEMVQDSPKFVDVKDTFQTVVDGFSDGYIVGHNIFYDLKVLENHKIKFSQESICTWRATKKLFLNTPDIEETNLPYLRFKLKLDVPIEMRCHRAGNDSFMTAKLLEVLITVMEETGIIDMTKEYGPQITKWLNEPIIYEIWPVGKHKGTLIKNLSLDYINWAVNNMDSLNPEAENYDMDLAASIAFALQSC